MLFVACASNCLRCASAGNGSCDANYCAPGYVYNANGNPVCKSKFFNNTGVKLLKKFSY